MASEKCHKTTLTRICKNKQKEKENQASTRPGKPNHIKAKKIPQPKKRKGKNNR